MLTKKGICKINLLKMTSNWVNKEQ